MRARERLVISDSWSRSAAAMRYHRAREGSEGVQGGIGGWDGPGCMCPREAYLRAAMALDAARVVFEQLGAAPDLARVASLVRRATSGEPWVDDA